MEDFNALKSPLEQMNDLKARYWAIYDEGHRALETQIDEETATEGEEEKFKKESEELLDITLAVAQIARDNNLPFDHEWVLWKNRPTT